MAKKRMFSGVIFLGFGLYFVLQHYNVQLFENLYTWPTLLIITGCAFLAQGYFANDHEYILPGAILTGLGIHFHIVQKLDMQQPDHAGVLLLLVSIGILLSYVKTGSGLMIGLLFLAVSSFLLFFDRLASWAVGQGHDLSMISNFWPFFFLAAGGYLLFVQRKK